MTNFNICIIGGETEKGAFLELAELIHFSLIELDYVSKISINHIEVNDYVNIIIGAHQLDPKSYDILPPSTIILNTEQIAGLITHGNMDAHSKYYYWLERLISLAKRFHIWDYSEKNIEIFSLLGFPQVKLFPIGFQPKLQRIKPVEQDIDVLFYGSINARRLHIFNELKELGLNVEHLFNVFGEDRDRHIARAKVVLNLHYFDSKIFEIVRCFYLMTNGVAIVSEIDKDTQIAERYLNAIVPADYSELAQKCKMLVDNPELRAQLQLNALEIIKEQPQAALLRRLLSETA
ncbi:hypothetical protein BMT54_00210 [Pasteurellaceae bacterium 15-036681]|nr:hypothetical protein BMT54_00210 [Pasteurellaceae bacterium 15-036681]